MIRNSIFSSIASILAISSPLAFAGIMPTGENAASVQGSYWEKYGTFSIQNENDFYAGLDQNYTNGIRLEWLSAPTPFSLSSENFLEKLLVPQGGNLQSQWGISFEQLMFTGITVDHKKPKFQEHPFGGYLALGGAYVIKNENVSNTWEFQLGTTGRNSLAKITQDRFHELIQSPLWKGWDDQLPNEITAQLSWQQKRRIAAWESNGAIETDGYWFWQADAGTVYCRANLGAIFRFGSNLSSISQRQQTIQPSNFFMQPFVTTQSEKKSNWSWFGQFGVIGRAVAHDIFLDGTVFRDAKETVNSEPFVLDLSASVGVRYRDLTLSFGYTMRTREYTTQNRHQTFGEAMVSWSF